MPPLYGKNNYDLNNVLAIYNDLMKAKLIAAYRKLFRVAFIIFYRVYIAGGFLRVEHVRRRGGGELS